MSETDDQIALVEWFRRQYPSSAEHLHHSPNEGMHKVQYRVKQKQMGVSDGFPDLALFEGRGGFVGFALELKAIKGKKPTQKQIDWLDRLAGQGWLSCWCKGVDAAIESMRDYMALPANAEGQSKFE